MRKFSGHLNEKNFVGLSCEQDFIACGSETSEASLTLFTSGILRRSLQDSLHAPFEVYRDWPMFASASQMLSGRPDCI